MLINISSIPVVSVIVPAYNCSKTISEALDSVLTQSYPAIEIIVINDGSSDSTPDILENYKSKIIIIDQENAGSAVSRSNGIRHATGKYIAFLDADDLWVPWKISTQVNYMELHPDVGMIFNSWILFGDESVGNNLPTIMPDEESLLAIDEKLSGYLYTQLLMECVVHTSAVLMLRRICTDVGDFDAALRRGQDYDYWLRVSRKTEIVKLASTLSAYRIHNASITQQAPIVNYEANLLLKAISCYGLQDQIGRKISSLAINKRLANSWAWGYCWPNYNAGYYRRAFDGALMAIKYHPNWYVGWMLMLKILAKAFLKNIGV